MSDSHARRLLAAVLLFVLAAWAVIFVIASAACGDDSAPAPGTATAPSGTDPRDYAYALAFTDHDDALVDALDALAALNHDAYPSDPAWRKRAIVAADRVIASANDILLLPEAGPGLSASRLKAFEAAHKIVEAMGWYKLGVSTGDTRHVVTAIDLMHEAADLLDEATDLVRSN